VFVAAVFLSIAFRSPVALALTLLCGLVYLFPYLAVFLLFAAVVFSFAH
jgi:hypothetical protein